MSARRRLAASTPAADTKCCVGSCGEPMTCTCSWKEHELNAETGERIYNGRVCGLKLCDTHAVRPAGGGVLCAWHATVARERGLVAA